jgi:DNA-binding CsgD family transcriptional regulator
MPLAALSFRPLFLEVLTRSHLALRDLDKAAAAAASALEAGRASRLPLAIAWGERATAAVALEAGDAGRAAALALSSADGADSAGAPIEAALARALAGRAGAEQGDRDRGVRLLAEAAEALERCGALRYRDAAERELRQLGERIHRRSQATAAEGTGVAALTKRELEIARRIVDRKTNREIAEELYLSKKTVETHIRNIFAKLGADSRVEVARMVEQADRAAGATP